MSSRRPRRARLASLLTMAVAATIAAGASGATERAAIRSPDFTVRTVSGKSFRLSAQRGKVVVFDFLVPSCGECQVEAPLLDRAAQRFGTRGLRVLVLDVGQSPDRELVSFYYGQLGLRHVAVAADTRLRVARRYGVTLLGTTVIVGRDGSRLWQGTWFGHEKDLFRLIARALVT